MRQVVHGVNQADRKLAGGVAELPRSAADPGMKLLTTAANHSLLWFAVAALLACRRGFARRAALRGVLAIAGASLAANALAKPVLPRRRPPAELMPLQRRLPGPVSSSFPSGHAASAAAFTTAVAMESPLAGALLAPVATGVSYSRGHTGVNWPSDVLAGALLGIGMALATRRWWPVRPPVPAQARPHAHAVALPAGKGLVIASNKQSGPQAVDPADEVAAALPAAIVVPVDDRVDVARTLDAVADGARAVGAAGGDGSAAAAAVVASRRRVPLAVFPAGTLNHFARDLGISSVQDSAAAVCAGDAVEVDLASVRAQGADGPQWRPFLNIASLGGYPDLVRMRERWAPRWGKWPAGAAALVRVLAAATPLQVHLDGQPHQLWLLFVGNGLYHPRGMVPLWRPTLTSGLLDVRYVRADLRLSRTRFVLGALFGALQRSRSYVQREAATLRVQVHGEPVALATDGEVMLRGTRFDFGVLDDRLVVYGSRLGSANR